MTREMRAPKAKQAGPTASAAAPSLELTPRGALVLVPAGPALEGDESAAVALPATFVSALEAAFARGTGHGLFALGALALATPPPPDLAYFRAFSRQFLSALCAQPELEARRAEVQVPPPGDDELARIAAGVPVMPGAEHLRADTLRALWAALEGAFRDDIAGTRASVQDYLRGFDPVWSLVGRVYFHLAENKRDPDAPFAFLATYSVRAAEGTGRVQHRPLGEALRQHAGARDKDALLALLLPVQRAAERSAWAKALVDSGEVFHPLAWTPREAYQLLLEAPVLEQSGVVLRLPDWWNARRPARPVVRVTVGRREPSALGLDALMDFAVDVALEGESLTREEQAQLLASTDGLALIRGRWVEVDREKLGAVLAHWKTVQKAAGREGVSFLQGMRWLAGASLPGDDDAGEGGADNGAEGAARFAWSGVEAGPWLAQALAELRDPAGDAADPGDALKTTLRPYQREGVRWLALLHRLGLGGCLADDMGLGKTVQVLAHLLLLQRARRREGGARAPALLVVPASLLANWQSEAARFAPSLRLHTVHASAGEARAPTRDELGALDVVLTTYGTLRRTPALAEPTWELAVLDEAQAIKTPGAQQTRAAKALRARQRLALTGTPVENHLGDLWSIFDFVNPGLLGSQKAFKRFATSLGDLQSSDGYAPLRRLIQPYLLRRLKTDRRVITDLPEKTEVRAYCTLTRAQAALYQRAVDDLARALRGAEDIARRGLVLAALTRFKQICNHPSQWLGDGAYAPGESGKFARLAELCEPIRERREKVLVFTQFREITDALSRALAAVFGRPGLVLHGGTPVAQRKERVARFQTDEAVPFFVLSLKAGGAGLNLTAASHVVHFDRWWNPAVEDQATDRAFRIGQRRNVLVHKFVCRGTLEERIDDMIEAKRGVARAVVAGGGEVALTELRDDELLSLVSLDLRSALGEGA